MNTHVVSASKVESSVSQFVPYQNTIALEHIDRTVFVIVAFLAMDEWTSVCCKMVPKSI